MLVSLIFVIKLLLTQSEMRNPDLLLLGSIPRVKDSWRILTTGLRASLMSFRPFNAILSKLCIFYSVLITTAG